MRFNAALALVVVVAGARLGGDRTLEDAEDCGLRGDLTTPSRLDCETGGLVGDCEVVRDAPMDDSREAGTEGFFGLSALGAKDKRDGRVEVAAAGLGAMVCRLAAAGAGVVLDVAVDVRLSGTALVLGRGGLFDSPILDGRAFAPGPGGLPFALASGSANTSNSLVAL